MGKPIHSEARNLILKVLAFFESEKANKQFVIPVDQVVKRTCAATGISKCTLMRIKKEANELRTSQGSSNDTREEKLSTPDKNVKDVIITHEIKKEIETVEQRDPLSIPVTSYNTDKVIIKEEIPETEFQETGYQKIEFEDSETKVECEEFEINDDFSGIVVKKETLLVNYVDSSEYEIAGDEDHEKFVPSALSAGKRKADSSKGSRAKRPT